MIPSPNKSPKVAEHTFNFGGQAKLEFLVYIDLVFDLPPLIDRLVNKRAVSLQGCLWGNPLEQKFSGFSPVSGIFKNDLRASCLVPNCLARIKEMFLK